MRPRPHRGTLMPGDHQATKSRKFVTRAGRELRFSALGFGSAPLGNYLRPLSEEESDSILAAAWRSGLRYYATPPLYRLGLSAMRAGGLLKSKPRTDSTLSTKVRTLL